jgi:hypothetical protein
MNVSKRITAAGGAVMVLGLLLGVLGGLRPFAAQARAPLADPAFESIWNRTDRPVEARQVNRSWVWGPEPLYTTYEPFAEGPGGQHLVSYFDKSRMEVNNPSGDRNSPWFVTNGLLVVEMISGKIQTGLTQYTMVRPAAIPVAGDRDSSVDAPTYAALGNVASLDGTRRAPNRTGELVRESLDRNGAVGTNEAMSGFARDAYYDSTLGHNIPDVFWSFLNARGMVYQDGVYQDGVLLDWVFAMGHPITEPYWIRIKVGGQERMVLMQAFQRRILTYSPGNPAGWQVEMGNVGRAYYDWRYGAMPAPPTVTPIPATATPGPAASISLNPQAGDAATVITVNGKNFPPNGAVVLGMQRNDGSGYRALATVAARGDGSFSARLSVPGDLAGATNLKVVATAKGGAVQALQPFSVAYDPVLTAASSVVTSNGQVRVRGSSFPPNTGLTLGIAVVGGGPITWPTGVKTDGKGTFDTTFGIGAWPVGTKFRVIAVGGSGIKVVTDTVLRVIGVPQLQLTPASGPAGANVTLTGTGWPAYGNVVLGLALPGSGTTNWIHGTFPADRAGNFAATVYVGPEYAGQTAVRVVAYEPVSLIRVETLYSVVNTPVARLVVGPAALAPGQVAGVTGTGWPAGAGVALGLSTTNAPTQVQEWLPGVVADANGAFTTSFVLNARWQNAGQVLLVGIVANGPAAITPITVLPSASGIRPVGLPLSVQRLDGPAQTRVTVTGQGWRAGRSLDILVLSADGTVNAPQGSVIVGDDGTFAASFAPAVAWATRSDLGVRVTTSDGAQYGLTYLPQATLTRSANDVYTATGANWPPGAQIQLLAHVPDGKAGDDVVLGRVTTAANGSWTLQVRAPGLVTGGKYDFVIRTQDQVFSVVFNY